MTFAFASSKVAIITKSRSDIAEGGKDKVLQRNIESNELEV